MKIVNIERPLDLAETVYMKNKLLICLYCSTPAKLVTGAIIYPHRADLATLMFWSCLTCDAYVGCHKKTTAPLGRLANAELRRAKNNAHRVFDPLWKNGKMSRRAAYQWLAENLGIPFKKTHIGEFDTAMCARVMAACSPVRKPNPSAVSDQT